MKKTLKSILAMVMILCMLFTVVGCGDTGTPSDEQQVAAGDNFFTDEKTENQTDTSSDGDTTSNAASNTQSTNKDDKDDKNDKNDKVTTTVLPDENKIGGKTWSEVLSSMPKKLRGTKLVMYNWNPASEYTGAPEVIDRFTRQTGIKVVWNTVTYANYFTKLPALIASGNNIPDVVRVRVENYPLLTNLQPLSKTGYDFSDEAWDQKLMDIYTYGKNTYATSLQNTHIGSVSLLFYNKALIDMFDMEDPYKLWKAGKWDWDKYIEMCREFVDLAGDGYFASCGDFAFTGYIPSFGLQGAISYDSKKGTFYNAMKDDYKDFLKVHMLLGDLYNKEKLFNYGRSDVFDDGRVLFSTGTAVIMRRKNAYFGNLKSNNTLMAVPLPKINGQKKYYQSYGEAEAYGIANGASNAEAVPYFLRYFLDGSNYELSNYFVNEQNLEVYNWCMNQKNRVATRGYPSGIGGTTSENSIELKVGSDMERYIEANKGIVDKAVKEYNEILSTLK